MTRRPRLCALLAASLLLLSPGCGLIVLPPTEAKVRAKGGFEWIEEHTADGRFTFLTERGVLLKEPLARRDEIVHAFLQRTLAFLDLEDPRERCTFAIVGSRRRMKDLLGVAPQAIANPDQRLVVGEPAALEVAHELAHVVSIRALGRSETWLQEGLAVAVDDRWFDQDLHALAQHLQTRGVLPPIHALARDFSAQDTLITYPQAGSFVKFLKETYGTAAFKAFWRSGHAGAAKTYGKELDQLEQEWLRFISKVPDGSIRYQIRADSAGAP